jgi:hypothetical protein
MTYEIEKNVSVEREDFPFAQMELTDSFVVADRTIMVRACNQARRLGYMLTTRKLADDRYRIWLKGHKA